MSRSSNPSECSHYFPALMDSRKCSWCHWDFRNGEPPETNPTPDNIGAADVLAVMKRTFKSAREYRAKDDSVDAFDHHDLLNDEIDAITTVKALIARNTELEALLEKAKTLIGDGVVKIAELEAENKALRDSLGEILDYRGGADSALLDEYVIERAQSAIASTTAPTDIEPAP